MSSNLSTILDNLSIKSYVLNMDTAKRIEDKIKTIKDGYVFTYKDLSIKKKNIYPPQSQLKE